MKLHDLLWCVAEKMAVGVEAERLYRYFLHTSNDFDGYIQTASQWSDIPVPDKVVEDLDRVTLFVCNFFDFTEQPKFELDEVGKPITNIVVVYVNDIIISQIMVENRGLAAILQQTPDKWRFQIPLPRESRIEYEGDLAMLDIIRQLSGILTPETDAFLDYMSKTVIHVRDSWGAKLHFSLDHNTKYIANGVIYQWVLIRTRVPIVDDLAENDLGVVFISLENEELLGLEFFPPEYDAVSENDKHEFHSYVVNLNKKTFRKKSKFE